MVLHVRYRNMKYDYVSSRMLDYLIGQKRINMLFRPSEKRWVDIELDLVLKEVTGTYDGIERRRLDIELYSIEYSVSQLPAYDKWPYVDPEYPKASLSRPE